MCMPPTKSQSLVIPSSVARSGRIGVERALVHSASHTLQSRNSGRLLDTVELVCSLLNIRSGHTQVLAPHIAQKIFDLSADSL